MLNAEQGLADLLLSNKRQHVSSTGTSRFELAVDIPRHKELKQVMRQESERIIITEARRYLRKQGLSESDLTPGGAT